MKKRNWQRQRWHSVKSIALGIGVVGLMTLSALASNPTQPDARTQQAMIDAINDEYRARAFYNAVIDQFGSIRPFSNIVQAEDRHVQLWNTLFTQYELPIPDDMFAGNIEAPATLQDACQMGVEAEIANVQMYDEFLEFVQEPDLRAAFTQLRYVSQNNHKPAFERCVTNSALLNRRMNLFQDVSETLTRRNKNLITSPSSCTGAQQCAPTNHPIFHLI